MHVSFEISRRGGKALVAHDPLHSLDRHAGFGHPRRERPAQMVGCDAFDGAGIAGPADRLARKAGRECLAVRLVHDQPCRLAPLFQVLPQPCRHRQRLRLPTLRDAGRIGLPGLIDPLPARGDRLALAQA